MGVHQEQKEPQPKRLAANQASFSRGEGTTSRGLRPPEHNSQVKKSSIKKLSSYEEVKTKIVYGLKGGNLAVVLTILRSVRVSKETANELAKSLLGILSGAQLEEALSILSVSDSIKGSFIKDEKLDTSKIFELIDARFMGAGTKELKVAMEKLYETPDNKAPDNEALATIAKIRGLSSFKEAEEQYVKAMEKRKKGRKNYKDKMKKDEEKRKKSTKTILVFEDPSPDLAIENSDFTATLAQLRFGKIVGDAFGLDAVFGSLISPTGGIAGPGNDQVKVAGFPIENGSAVATHGAIHDAMGYLYNCHGIGPGYDYLGREPNADPSDPLAGQSNVSVFIDEYERRGKKVELRESVLNLGTHISEAFSKNSYTHLKLQEKKKVLLILCDRNSFARNILEIQEETRGEKIRLLLGSYTDTEKEEVANFIYLTIEPSQIDSIVHQLIGPYVSPLVLQRAYIRRRYPVR